jgi:stage II sporulation protein D
LIPNGPEPLTVAGGHRYFGEIQIASAGDGLVLSDRLPLERYLLGLNEVPTTWPTEALRAQAVAARTYALYTLSQPPGGDASVYGFDICASVQCQVFSGADVIDSITGGRWIDAVESTAGQTILYNGRPILARYHSTSGGRTLNNEQVFPEEGPYPYLVSVDSPTEEGSPLFRWSTSFELKDLQRILVRAGWWDTTLGHLEGARSEPSTVGFHYPDVVLDGSTGDLRRTAEELREVVRDLGPQIFPRLYPGPAATASGRLPETFPSNRVGIFTRGRIVEVVGRGWGHGVGMSQWGAEGLARRGASYADILNHYYTGVSIGTIPDSGPIEVGLDWGLPTATVAGSFRIVDGHGRTIVKHALGSWRFDWPGAGAVSVEPPRGYGLPLNVGIVNAPKRVEVGEPVYLTVALSRPARVTTKTARAPTGYLDPGTEVKEAGRRRVVWLAPLEAGTYSVRVTADAGAVARRSEPVSISVAEEQSTVVIDRGAQFSYRPPTWMLIAGGAFLLAALLTLSVFLTRRGNRGVPGPPS